MARVPNKYVWAQGIGDAPTIEPHSKIKHSIINDYIRNYLKVVITPITSHVKLVIVDGFCGGGLYKTEKGDAHFGSPVIILDALRETVAEILGERLSENITRELSVECTVYFIDKDPKAIETLKIVSAPHLVVDQALPLKIIPHFIQEQFVNVYKDVLSKIGRTKAIFILDPCGYKEVPLPILKEIMHTGDKREIIWTLMIETMLAFANDKSVALENAGYSNLLNLFKSEDKPSDFVLQKEVFNTIVRDIGVPFFTPFAIKQSKGWHYWLIHLAWHHRASEVMKDVEHMHANEREHYGRAGLSMMAAEGQRVYMFGQRDIDHGKELLYEDIPQILSTHAKDGITFDNFMKLTYNQTPLKSDTIKEALVAHDAIEIMTATKGLRYSPKRIKQNDIIMLRKQGFLNFKPILLN